LLERTFVHIPGIGPKTEQYLWQKGILTWSDFLLHDETPLSPGRATLVRQNLEASLENKTNIRFFVERLSPSDTWRLFSRFRHKAVYLDIETSGLYQGIDEITVIGIYDGQSVKTFVQGINLDEFEIAIADYELIVTFNGSQFDLPFIRRQFPNIALPPAHIDLRFFLKKLGYRGGLKVIEKYFGLSRDSDIDGLDGYDAVLLWHAYQNGDEGALDRLIQYNTADIVDLEPLMEQGYHEMKERLLSVCNFRFDNDGV
jgi:uncharacterized protein YprB with RNaseH-like and TPR domain